jgi:hypothetical protein
VALAISNTVITFTPFCATPVFFRTRVVRVDFKYCK